MISKIYLSNVGPDPATVGVFVRYVPQYSQVVCIPVTALGIVVIFLVYIVQRMASPRMFAVALSTFKSEVAQPLFALVVSGGVCALIAFVWIPYNTFGEDIKMLKDTGLTLILVLSIVLALWSASTSVAEEIEGRTALTGFIEAAESAFIRNRKICGHCLDLITGLFSFQHRVYGSSGLQADL